MSIWSAARAASQLYSYEQAYGARDLTSSEMRQAIKDWYGLYYNTAPEEGEDPCQRIPTAIVSKLYKAIFSEYTAQPVQDRAGFLSGVLAGLDRIRKKAVQQMLIGGCCLLKPDPEGFDCFHVIDRQSYLVFGRDAHGHLTDVGISEVTRQGRMVYTLLERRTVDAGGYLTITSRLFRSESEGVLGTEVPLASLEMYEDLPAEIRYSDPVYSVGLIPVLCPAENCVDGSEDGVSVYAPAVGLIHNINRNEYQLAREFELGRMRIAASADLLTAENGRKRLRDDLFVGLEGSEQTVGITAFAPALRNENYEARRQAYLKAVENLLGVKRGILSDAEAVSKTATEINSSAGDYSLSIIEFQNLYYDALQAALRLADQLGQAYRLCDGTAWDTEVLNVTWGNGVLYDADKEWADRLAMVQQGMLRPELALAWKFDLPCDTEEDLAAIRQKYMPTMQDMES